jgi:hypothetical protein
MLRPACRRCTARCGIAEPVACHLPPHRTVCRRHRLWAGPSARTHASQLDISPLPEILRAQRRHLAQLHHHHHWQLVDIAVSDATHTVLRALASAPGPRASCNASASSTPPHGTRPRPVPDLAGKATAQATPPSRSRSTPTSSGWPHATSGHPTSATVRHGLSGSNRCSPGSLLCTSGRRSLLAGSSGACGSLSERLDRMPLTLLVQANPWQRMLPGALAKS